MPDVSIFWVPLLSMGGFEQACTSIVATIRLQRGTDNDINARKVVQEHLSKAQSGR
jgi:hypothetical protein